MLPGSGAAEGSADDESPDGSGNTRIDNGAFDAFRTVTGQGAKYSGWVDKSSANEQR